MVGILASEMPKDGVAEKGQWGREGNPGEKIRLLVGVGGETEPNHFGNEAVVGVFGTVREGKEDGDTNLLVETMLASAGEGEADAGAGVVFGEVEEGG